MIAVAPGTSGRAGAPAGPVEDVIRALPQIADAAAEHGVQVGVELLAERRGSVISTIPDMIAVLDEVNRPNLGIMLDVFHNWCEPDVHERMRRYADRINSVQVCDIKFGERGGFDREYPGRGRGAAVEFVATMIEAGYTGYWELEVFSDDGTYGNAYPDSYWIQPHEQFLTEAKKAFDETWAAAVERVESRRATTSGRLLPETAGGSAVIGSGAACRRLPGTTCVAAVGASATPGSPPRSPPRRRADRRRTPRSAKCEQRALGQAIASAATARPLVSRTTTPAAVKPFTASSRLVAYPRRRTAASSSCSAVRAAIPFMPGRPRGTARRSRLSTARPAAPSPSRGMRGQQQPGPVADPSRLLRRLDTVEEPRPVALENRDVTRLPEPGRTAVAAAPAAAVSRAAPLGLPSHVPSTGPRW